MGKKLDAVKSKSKEGGERYRESKELGKKAVSDVKQMKSLIDSLPTDVDDEIEMAAKAVSEGTKSDAEHYMGSEVNSKVEAGKKGMEASTKDANDQIKNNERVKATFARMDSVGAFGKNARSEGTSRVEQSTQEFNKVITDNEQETRAAEDAFKKDLSDISSTF